jgi:hypothetical protein
MSLAIRGKAETFSDRGKPKRVRYNGVPQEKIGVKLRIHGCREIDQNPRSKTERHD